MGTISVWCAGCHGNSFGGDRVGLCLICNGKMYALIYKGLKSMHFDKYAYAYAHAQTHTHTHTHTHAHTYMSECTNIQMSFFSRMTFESHSGNYQVYDT